jgi:biopolymer transport protein ExbB
MNIFLATVSETNLVDIKIDWYAEFLRGGNTSVALGILFLLMIAFAIERFLSLRIDNICPKGLTESLLDKWHSKDFNEIYKICENKPSILSDMIIYLAKHNETDPGLLIPGAEDVGNRELRKHLQKTLALAVVASLAPLLGLLGTMIGMIESFKLVEIYGDAGGASMLAGAISKALITTAVGLIIAIPALSLYHFFKYRINDLSIRLEKEFDNIISVWLLKKINLETLEKEKSSTDNQIQDSSSKK